VRTRLSPIANYISRMNQPMPNSPDISLPERAPSAASVDDVVTPFEVASLDLRGRLVRLGPMVDEILSKHAYPLPVAKLLGEAIVLTVMLGSSLKMNGRFILQAQTDGPVGLLVVDYTTPGHVRACARYGAAGVEALAAAGEATSGNLLGKGHLAMTIDQGENTQRYQGLVALDGMSLEDAAHEYFLRSEQIPTRVRIAVAEEIKPGTGAGSHRWRAGGVMLQFLPQSQTRAQTDLHPGDAPDGIEVSPVIEDDAWVQGRTLLETVEDVELVDPELSSERLAYRLFHEPGVRVFNALDVRAQCSCSRDAVESMLKSFSQDDRDHMVEDGKISVTCEFCSSTYVFQPEDVGANAGSTN
jgi:molecular chaperone Hsp33